MRETYRFTDVVCTVCHKEGSELLSREDQPEKRCSCGGERLRVDSAPVGSVLIAGEFKVIHPDGAKFGHVSLNECREILASQGRVVKDVEYIDRSRGVHAEEALHNFFQSTAQRSGITIAQAEKISRGEAPQLAREIHNRDKRRVTR